MISFWPIRNKTNPNLPIINYNNVVNDYDISRILHRLCLTFSFICLNTETDHFELWDWWSSHESSRATRHRFRLWRSYFWSTFFCNFFSWYRIVFMLLYCGCVGYEVDFRVEYVGALYLLIRTYRLVTLASFYTSWFLVYCILFLKCRPDVISIFIDSTGHYIE